jgi:small subunit ribosomal protein S20
VAHSLSAKKRIRQNLKRKAHNRWRKDQIKDAVKEFESARAKGDAKAAAELYRKASRIIDRVASKNTIHKNTAARKRSSLARRLNAMSKGPAAKKA